MSTLTTLNVALRSVYKITAMFYMLCQSILPMSFIGYSIFTKVSTAKVFHSKVY